MRAVFGVVSLLVVVAVVALLAKSQLRALGPAAPASSGTPAAGATVQDASREMQRKAVQDVTRALEQGAARASESSP